MVKVTILKVNIACQKCKRGLFNAAAKLEGLNKIEVDEEKGILTVTGDADPYYIILKVREVDKYAQVVSIGPPPAPKKPDEKKPNEKDETCIPYMAHPWSACDRVAQFHVEQWDEPNSFCSIL